MAPIPGDGLNGQTEARIPVYQLVSPSSSARLSSQIAEHLPRQTLDDVDRVSRTAPGGISDRRGLPRAGRRDKRSGCPVPCADAPWARPADHISPSSKPSATSTPDMENERRVAPTAVTTASRSPRGSRAVRRRAAGSLNPRPSAYGSGGGRSELPEERSCSGFPAGRPVPAGAGDRSGSTGDESGIRISVPDPSTSM